MEIEIVLFGNFANRPNFFDGVGGAILRGLRNGDYFHLRMVLVAQPLNALSHLLSIDFTIGCRKRYQFAT